MITCCNGLVDTDCNSKTQNDLESLTTLVKALRSTRYNIRTAQEPNRAAQHEKKLCFRIPGLFKFHIIHLYIFMYIWWFYLTCYKGNQSYSLLVMA